MNKSLFSTLFLIAVLPPTSFNAMGQRTTGWHGIIPLHSTRADVHRLLGRPEGACQCVYRTPTEIVSIDYAEASCKGAVNGWNVSRDTVLQVRITPVTPRTFSELGFDESSFVKTRDDDDAATSYFTDLEHGIRYAVQDSHVVSVRYTPLRSDKGLRCPGFPVYDGGLTDYHPYDSFPRGAREHRFAHLDELAFQLNTRSAFKAYIVAYAGKIAKPGEAKNMAKTARDYLIHTRGIPADKVSAIDGGFREEAEFELYLIQNGMAPPTPKPTLTSAEVTLITSRRSRRRP
jgi:hypothetical protein